MFRIANWDNLYETAETRKLKYLRWIPLRNRLEDDGATELLAHDDGIAHLGIWCALLQIASNDTFKRGYLTRAGPTCRIEHDINSIARKLRTKPALVQVAIGRLLEIGWLQYVKDFTSEPTSNDCNSQEIVGRSQEKTGAELKGIERNRIEENRIRESFESNLGIKPETIHPKDSESAWYYECKEPWAIKLKPICGTLGKKTWPQFKALVDRFGLDHVATVAFNTIGQWKWADDLAAILANCKPDVLIPEDPDTSRAIVILKAKGWQQAVDYVGLSGVSSEQEAIAECRINPGLVAELLEWANAN